MHFSNKFKNCNIKKNLIKYINIVKMNEVNDFYFKFISDFSYYTLVFTGIFWFIAEKIVKGREQVEVDVDVDVDEFTLFTKL